MASLSAEAEALARRSGQECKALRDLITALTSRVTALEAGGGGGDGSTITYTDGVASADAAGTTIYWIASETNPDA